MLYTPGAGLSILMREGDPAPGSGGCLFGSVSSGSGWVDQGFSRSTGRFSFVNSMTGGDVTGNTDDTCIFAGQIGVGIDRIARESEPAPTGVLGEIYQAFFPNGRQPINDNGTVVFVAQLGPTGVVDTFQDVAVFRAVPPYGPGDVTMILREGQAVDGLPPGWTIGNTNGGGMASSSTTLMLNDRDAVLVGIAGVGDPLSPPFGIPATIAWTPEHGARAFYVQGDTFTVAGNPYVTTAAANFQSTISNSSDGSSLHFNNNGDVCTKLFAGSQNAVVRGHVGQLMATPASVPAAGGVSHALNLDFGPALANNFYIVLASSGGTRPGFGHPLNPLVNVPINFDPLWITVSYSFNNTAIWFDSFGVTDANGKAVSLPNFPNLAAPSFNVPLGDPDFMSFAGTTVHHTALTFDAALVGTGATEPAAVRLY
jgi:hypothetical protein